MHHLKLKLGLTALLVAVVAAVLAAGTLTPAPRQAEAANPTPTPKAPFTIAITDANGVICGRLNDLTLTPIGGAPVKIYAVPFGTTLARIDHNLSNNDVTVTAVAYTEPVPALDLTWPNCKTPQAAMPVGANVPDVANEVRPSVLGTYNKDNTISGSSCQANFVFGGFTLVGSTNVNLELNLRHPNDTQLNGTFTFINTWSDANCSVASAGAPQLGTLVVHFTGVYLAGPDEPKYTFNSDWDKDGFSDWHELDPKASPFRDPFAADNPAVGGIAELAEGAGTPLAAPDSSGTSTSLIAGVLAAVAAGVVALGGAAWYTKRRL